MYVNSPKLWRILAGLLVLNFLTPNLLHSAAAETPNTTTVPATPTNQALLIFLDDAEGQRPDENSLTTLSVLSAVLEDAGPILVSGALLKNLSDYRPVTEWDPTKLTALWNKSRGQIQKELAAALSDFNGLIEHNWVLKTVNSELCLLLPKSYLESQGIKLFSPPEQPGQQFLLKNGNATLADLTLGLKVSRMHTFTLGELWSTTAGVPAEPRQFADYFMTALRENQLFLTKKDYFVADPELPLVSPPAWSIYLSGHGLINYAIAHLSLAQFKEFLNFLDTKINTRLLYYNSCYAAGVNIELVYKELSTGLQRTYAYAIITQALTDTTTSGYLPKLLTLAGRVEIKSNLAYREFITIVTNPQTLDYTAIAKAMTSVDQIGSNTPQIKFPGLPWFSVLDQDKVIEIGQVLAKTRTAPLNTATWSGQSSTTIAPARAATPTSTRSPSPTSPRAKSPTSARSTTPETSTITKTRRANPLAILLYTPDIPFELLIEPNTQTVISTPPAIISMLPGDAVHHLKKISSTTWSVDQILNSFLQLKNLKPHKLFLIDQIASQPKNQAPYVIQDVLISLRPDDNRVYFKFNDPATHSEQLYIAINPAAGVGLAARLATAPEQADYARLVAQYRVVEAPEITTDSIRALQAAANQKFIAPLTVTQTIQAVTDILNSQPAYTVLYINKISGVPYSAEHSTPWLDLITALAQYRAVHLPAGARKILWIDRIDTGRKDATGRDVLEYTDIIIDCTPQATKVYFKINRAQPQKLHAGSYSPAASYVSLFDELRAHFDTHLKLPDTTTTAPDAARPGPDTSSIYTALTPASVAKLEAVQQRKLEAAEVMAELSALDGGGVGETKGPTPDQDGI